MKARNRLYVALSAATVVVLFVVALPAALGVLARAAGVREFTWSCSEAWAACAETARAEGVVLAARQGSALRPAADVSLGDDIGHNLFLGLRSMMHDEPLTPSECARFNVIVSCGGFLLVALMLVIARFRVAALLFVGLGGLLIPESPGTNPHPSHPGVAMFALVFCVAAAARVWARRPESVCGALLHPRANIAGFWWQAVGVSAGMFAVLLRGAIMMPLAIATMATSLLAASAASRFVPSRNRQLWRPMAVTVIVLVAVANLGLVVLRVRDLVWQVPSTKQIESHGISHNLTIGLGVVDNKFGIKWADSCGWELAKRIDPNVGYVTRAYYEALWRVYWSLWRDDPVEMARIYYQKFLGMSSERAFGWIPLWLAAVLSVIIAWASIRRAGAAPAARSPHFLIALPSCILLLGFFAQGVLVNPSPNYWKPMEGLLLVCVALAIDMAVCRASKTVDPEHAPFAERSLSPAVATSDRIAMLSIAVCAGALLWTA